jgi:hypothetical protein
MPPLVAGGIQDKTFDASPQKHPSVLSEMNTEYFPRHVGETQEIL